MLNPNIGLFFKNILDKKMAFPLFYHFYDYYPYYIEKLIEKLLKKWFGPVSLFMRNISVKKYH
jgi:hypothetical protein